MVKVACGSLIVACGKSLLGSGVDLSPDSRCESLLVESIELPSRFHSLQPHATSSRIRAVVSASPIRIRIHGWIVGQLDECLGSKIDQEDIDRLRIVEVAAEHDR